MKKFLVILAVLATAAVFFSSCGKGCKCTYKEDGKKIYVRESDYRYFDKHYAAELVALEIYTSKAKARSIIGAMS